MGAGLSCVSKHRPSTPSAAPPLTRWAPAACCCTRHVRRHPCRPHLPQPLDLPGKAFTQRSGRQAGRTRGEPGGGREECAAAAGGPQALLASAASARPGIEAALGGRGICRFHYRYALNVCVKHVRHKWGKLLPSAPSPSPPPAAARRRCSAALRAGCWPLMAVTQPARWQGVGCSPAHRPMLFSNLGSQSMITSVNTTWGAMLQGERGVRGCGCEKWALASAAEAVR